MVSPRRSLPQLLLACALALAGGVVAAQEPPASAIPTPAPTPGASPTPAPPATPKAAPAGRCPAGSLDFELPFPADKGGGTVTGCAGNLEMVRGDKAVLAGGVQVHYQDIEVTADRMEIDLTTKVVTATGEVILDQGPRRVTGTTLLFDLGTKTGRLSEATAFVAPDYYFSGTEIAKVGDDLYTVDSGVFTSCKGDSPAWSFKVARGRVQVGGYAHVRGAAMRIKKVPILYTPYLVWPVKEERTSGFLVPQPGYSQRHGASLSLGYYQVLGRSYDTTVELDTYGDGFVGLGNDFRYRPSEGTKGRLVGYGIRDLDQKTVRWKVDWDHETTDLPWGLRGVISYHDFSDFNFFRDFDRDFNRNTIRFLDSRGFITGNWGPNLLNVLVNRRETFITDTTTITLSKLPELEYRLRPSKIGPTPFYLQLDTSVDYLDQSRPGTLQGTYGRFDLFPQVTLPLRPAPWLSLSLTAGERLTYYSDRALSAAEISGRPPAERDQLAGESLTRTIPTASAELVGPSFSRIFNGPRGSKLKHVFEPRFTYSFLDDFARRSEVPLFDEVDAVTASNVGRFALVNRLLAKPGGNKGGSAREVLLLELAQNVSFDDTKPLQSSSDGKVTSSRGPLEALLRFNPSAGTSLKVQVDYNTLFREIQSSSISGSYGLGTSFVNLTWFTRRQAEQGRTVSNQVRLGAGVNVLPGKLRLEGQVNYDFQLSLLQQQRYILDYLAQCWGLRFEVRDFTAQNFRTTDYRISFTLKNVGTFLDLTGGLNRGL